MANGSAQITGTMLQLTNGGQTEAGSGWYPEKVGVAKFGTSFDFQLPTSAADGFTFTLQNDGGGYLALGGNGSAYGYQGIGNSVAVAFGFYESGVTDAESVGVYTGGASPHSASLNMIGSGLNLHSGDIFHAQIAYSNGTMTVTLTDKNTGATGSVNFSVDVVGAVGGSNAYAGFTGSTGALTSTQNILNWTYTN